MKKVMVGFAVFLGAMVICTLISKSVYAYSLPMVSTCQPEAKYIEHKVEAEGIVVAGGERTVTYLPGLRIDSVMVHVGDRVEEGDLLFQVDLDDLKNLMEEKQNEISKVNLQINTILENQAIEQQKKELELARAREDFDTTSRQQDTLVGRAMENYVQAENELEKNGEDKELKAALQSAAYGEADARGQRDEAVKQAQREVEDLLLPDNVSAELDMARLEQSELSAKMQEYQKIMDSQGMVTAPFDGVVTEISVGAGDRVPDTAVLLLADESIPCQLKITLDKEQKKYISLGDQVSIKLEGKSRDLEEKIDYLAENRNNPELYEALITLPERTGVPGESGTIFRAESGEKYRDLEEKIDYLAENRNNPELYEALITLPEGTGVPGESGTIFRAESGEKYRVCLPMAAVYSENDRSFIYVLKEREGILGQEYYVDEMNVKVIDKNDNWVAIEEGMLDKDSKIILSSTKELKKGEVVRWEEEE